MIHLIIQPLVSGSTINNPDSFIDPSIDSGGEDQTSTPRKQHTKSTRESKLNLEDP